MWALDGTGASLGSVSLAAAGNQTGGVPVALVGGKGYSADVSGRSAKTS